MNNCKRIGMALVACLGIAVIADAAAAATSNTVHKQVVTYGPSDVEAALYGSVPRWHWLAHGNLAYMVRKSGKPQSFVFDPKSDKLTPTKNAGHGSAHGSAEPQVVAPGLMGYSPPIRELPSADGKWFAGTRSGNLYLRPATGKSLRLARTARRMTATRCSVRAGRRTDATWRHRRMDASGVPTVPVVDWAAAGQPVKRWLYSRVGQPIVHQTLVIADRHSAKVSAIKLDPALAYLHPVSWSPGSRYLYVMATTRLMKRIDLIRVDAATGEIKTLLSEQSKTNVVGSQAWLFERGYAPDVTDLHYVTMLTDGRFIWTSERDGWRRLYLYTADGTLIRALTPTGIVVQRVFRYDAVHGIVYYVAQAQKNKPYRNALFGVTTNGGSPVQVAYGPQFFHIVMRSDGRYFAIAHGGLDAAPVVDVYDRHGRRLRTLWSGQKALSRFTRGKAEAFVATAADGKTPIHGLLFKPADFDASKHYPVVEWIYAGPQASIVASSQGDSNYWTGQALASAGFIAVEIDGRGTPGRGRAFQDAFYGRIGQGEIADHVAVLHQIAATRPWMDMSRVGVMGHSWGGYFAPRALLQAPDLYRAAVASAGPASLRDFRVAIEPYMGCLPRQCPDAYAKSSNMALVSHMKGRLLIMQGTADRDVPFGESMRMIAALEKAGKSYQYVAFPGQPHTIYESPYWWHRIVAFFKQTLGTAQTIHKQESQP